MKRFLKKLLHPRWCERHQHLRMPVPCVLEAMHGSARDVNKVSRRRIHGSVAHANRQCPFPYVERLVLAVVNVRRWASRWRDREFRHEDGPTGFLAGDEKRKIGRAS